MVTPRGKTRIDRLLVERGLAPSRERAASLVMAGCVLVNEVPAVKAGQLVSADATLRVRGQDHPYVSRGGMKLARALEAFGVRPAGKACMDVGASTGGFTDCLLKQGAARVYAIDVGYGQLAHAMATDARVVVLERTNIRTLAPERIPEPIALAVIDVSFISLALVLPAVDRFLAPEASVVALIKPQFEVGRELVGKGGIVKDPASHELAIAKVRERGVTLGWRCDGIIESPILGAKGNKEFLICFRKP
jgi:23S rRNA (cytidine1920-2'-O)/16S rRNA (cytidine1409-2'-O)-methyltransferase